jgi:hypothetical protein
MKNIFIIIVLLSMTSCYSTKVVFDYHEDATHYIIVEKNDIPHVIYKYERGSDAFISPGEKYIAITDHECSNSSKIVIVSLDTFEPIKLDLKEVDIPKYSDHIYFEFKNWISDNEFTYSVLAYNGQKPLNKEYKHTIK